MPVVAHFKKPILRQTSIILACLVAVTHLTSFGQINSTKIDTLCATPITENPDENAHYYLGKDALIDFLNEYSLIPISTKQTDFPVRIKLLVCANSDFTIVEIKNENSEIPTLVTETERLIKLLRGIEPAKKNGEFVSSYCWIQINFNPKKKVRLPDKIIKIE